MAQSVFSSVSAYPNSFMLSGDKISFQGTDFDLFEDNTHVALRHVFSPDLQTLSVELFYELLMQSLSFFERQYQREGQYLLFVAMQSLRRSNLQADHSPLLVKGLKQPLRYEDVRISELSLIHLLDIQLSKIAFHLPWHIPRYEVGIEDWHLENVFAQFEHGNNPQDHPLYRRFQYLYLSSIGAYLDWIIPQLLEESGYILFHDKVAERFAYNPALPFIVDQIKEHAPLHFLADLTRSFFFLLLSKALGYKQSLVMFPEKTSLQEQQKPLLDLLVSQMEKLVTDDFSLSIISYHYDKETPEIIQRVLRAFLVPPLPSMSTED